MLLDMIKIISKMQTSTIAVFLLVLVGIVRSGAPELEFDHTVLYTPNTRQVELINSGGEVVRIMPVPSDATNEDVAILISIH